MIWRYLNQEQKWWPDHSTRSNLTLSNVEDWIVSSGSISWKKVRCLTLWALTTTSCKKNAAYLFLLRILYSPRHLKLFKLKNYMNIKTLYLDKNGPISICFNVRYWCRILSAKARLWGTRCGFLIKTNRAKIKSSHVLLIFQCNIFVFCNFLLWNCNG